MFEFYKHVCLSLLFVYTNFIVRPSNYLQSNLGVFFLQSISSENSAGSLVTNYNFACKLSMLTSLKD